ncbi:Tetratricopeptide repeat-containing protein [Rubritalea squalenifaciens DSM 18772]|uniref:Tetratricopeptide repeat-containing protein n=1 Tax=Rubritalea squalenifaciens DSM 18772 TaxID=1123071 RepID=A0A1M6KZ81_9BACT|nr:tetratricopeptide repeat protein [Rubritalea squalenifaciens]SHJ64184.1 Tetratricopeptide repeat-containing protein [Rubritalea squalenifaciens DSM 18772]
MRRSLSILTLSLTLPLASAQDAAPTVNLAEVPSYQRGIEALADYLPEQAVIRLQEAYKVRGLTDEQNQTILIKLAEAQVRSGLAEEALKTLDIKYLQDYPGSTFWRGQALAVGGQYNKAIELLSTLEPKDPFYGEAMLTAANLSEALGDTSSAIEYLKKSSSHSDKAIQLRSYITLAEIYLQQDRLEDARQVLARTPDNSARATRLKEFMRARIAFREEKYADAISLYRSLLESSDNVPKRIYDLTLLGIIDSRYASGDKKGATSEALEFIKANPQSTTLQPLLERVTQWIDQDISESDSVLLQLRDWAGRTPNPNAPISPFPDTGSVVSQPPQFGITPASAPEELSALAHFYYAKLIAHSSLVNANERALFELSAFRALNPTHPLFADSLLETAKIELKRGNKDAALAHLNSLQDLADAHQLPVSSTTEAKAAYLRGLLSINFGNYNAALDAFEIATKSTSPTVASNAAINAGLAALRTADLKSFDKQLEKIDDEKLRVELLLEKALWLANLNHPEARPTLNQFTSRYPDHPRIAEARIALASLCISQPPMDPVLCTALLDTINPDTLNEEQFTQYARAKYQLASFKHEWKDAADIASNWLEKYPANKQAAEFSMRNGLALYRNGEHNKARQVLGKLAMDYPESPLTPMALYYAAMAARQEGTPQALQESVEIFAKVIDSNSPVSLEARIQQARLLIDLNRVDEAVKSLESVYEEKANGAQQREIGILLAAALHTQGSTDPSKYKQAIQIYDTLLKQRDLNLAWNNQIHFLKGQALESMGDQKGALDAYYSVINRENVPKGTAEDDQEWYWFYRCGRKALLMLENADRPRAAIAIANKIASYANGPQAQEFAERARNLEMEHMIWEER